jgi:peptide/nickel transport system substrate-binding protein
MDRADPAPDEHGGEADQANGATPTRSNRDAGEAALRTFLIADIRGYTTYTRERGDEAAAVLAMRFAELVSEVVVARGGSVPQLRGDEALIVFVSARQALRVAVELQEQFRQAELPRGVGIGLDAGEAVAVEDGYRGGALNVAARLCAQAGPGQILASEAVIHLAAHVDGLAYIEPRSLRLKGLAQPIRTVSVVPEERAPRGMQRRLRRARRVLRFDRRSLIVGLGTVAALAVAGVAVWIATDGLRALTAAPGEAEAGGTLAAIGVDELPTLAFVDSSTGELIDTVAVRNPVEMQSVDGSLWVLGLDPKAVYRIDPATHEVVQTITVPLAKEGWWTVDGEILWFTDFGEPGHVIGIDIGTQLVVRDFTLTTDSDELATANGVAVGAGSLWISRPQTGEILRLDPVSGEIQASIETFAPDILAFGEGALWTTGFGRIARIDPATNRPSFEARELAEDRFLAQIAFGGGHAWTADEEQGIVWRVDRTGSVVGTYQTGAGARPLAFADGTMWVGNQDAGTLSGIDVVTDEVTTLDLGHSNVGIAAVEGEIAVSVWPNIDERLATLDGQVLRIAMPGDPFFGLAPDPPVGLTFEIRQVEYATCASLLTYPDVPAPDGWELQPEVAEAMPEVSADGLTYTFRVREGFAFSPPSNQPLTAETFRYSIERALSPGLGEAGRGIQFLGDIAGAQAFHEGEADAVEGLAADGKRLTITLEAPAADLLSRLALPYFCPVPIGTPVALDGLDPRPPLASAGPYYLAEHEGGELAILRPNPNYTGSRPQHYDHIVLRLGINDADAVGRVQSGEIDAAVTPPFQSLLSPARDLAREWGPGSEAAANGDQRWFGGPRFGLTFIALNPQDELFSDVDVRRAVSLAIDRASLAASFDEAPFASLLAPSVRGSPPVDAPLPEPDPDAAEELMSGRSGTAVIVAPAQCGDCLDFGNTLAGNLAVIGIELEVRPVEGDVFEAISGPGSDVDVVQGFLDTDYPDPAALLGSIRDEVPWLPDWVHDELGRVEGLAGDERIDAAAELAERLSDEEYLAIPVAYPVFPMFIGETVGCAFVQPAIGAVDLAALCPE